MSIMSSFEGEVQIYWRGSRENKMPARRRQAGGSVEGMMLSRKGRRARKRIPYRQVRMVEHRVSMDAEKKRLLPGTFVKPDHDP
jgi:hypothetical protein